MKRSVQICKAIVVSGLLETMRRREVYVLLILTVMMLLGAYSFSFFGLSGLEIFVKDMAFTCVGLFSTIIGVVIAGRQVPEEIQHRTIYPMLARPVTRWQLLLGKFISAWFTTCLCFFMLTLAVWVLLLIMHISLGAVLWQFMLLKCFSFMWLSGFTICLSLYMSQGAAITVAALLALSSGAFIRAYTLFYNQPSPFKPLIVALYGLLPNYNLFDMTQKLIYGWKPIALVDILALAIYGVVIGLFWLWVGLLRFQKQAI